MPADAHARLQAARERARALGWDDGLIDRALEHGYGADAIGGALEAKLTDKQASLFLDRPRIPPDLTWMRAPTEWGVRAAPADAERGLTLADVMLGSYGEVPDVWTDRTEIARGSHPIEGLEGESTDIFVLCATDAFSTTLSVHLEDCEGWWLFGCCCSVTEHWWLKPKVS